MYIKVFKEAITISIFVLIMMIIVDFLDVISEKRLTDKIKGGKWRQYVLAAFLGATPGCLGAFMVASLYMHGQLSMGAVIGCMIATSGDESFVMLAKIPRIAILMTILLFFFGICLAWLADRLLPFLGIKPSLECQLAIFHPKDAVSILRFSPLSLKENFNQFSFYRFSLLLMIVFSIYLFITGKFGPSVWNWQRVTFVSLLCVILIIITFSSEHYLREHIWSHLIKNHLFRIFFWTLVALLFIELGLKYFNLELFIKQHLPWILFTSAIVGVIPESGPHLVFLLMYIQGLIPFSVLLTSSIVQDGHGMLPLLSHNLKDCFWIKLFNLIFGLFIGGSLYLLGQ